MRHEEWSAWAEGYNWQDDALRRKILSLIVDLESAQEHNRAPSEGVRQ